MDLKFTGHYGHPATGFKIEMTEIIQTKINFMPDLKDNKSLIPKQILLYKPYKQAEANTELTEIV